MKKPQMTQIGTDEKTRNAIRPGFLLIGSAMCLLTGLLALFVLTNDAWMFGVLFSGTGLLLAVDVMFLRANSRAQLGWGTVLAVLNLVGLLMNLHH